MRGADAFLPVDRAPAGSSDDDSSDGDGANAPQRRKAAKSTMSETWRLYLMQIPSQTT